MGNFSIRCCSINICYKLFSPNRNEPKKTESSVSSNLQLILTIFFSPCISSRYPNFLFTFPQLINFIHNNPFNMKFIKILHLPMSYTRNHRISTEHISNIHLPVSLHPEPISRLLYAPLD